MKTLYLSDLDGTLLNKNAELSEKTTKILNGLIEKGVNFSVATARTFETAKKILEKLALKNPLVLMNGVLIYDPETKRYIKKEILSGVAKTKIIEAMRKVKISGLMYALHDDRVTTYYEKLDTKPLQDFVNERITKYDKLFASTDDFFCVTDDNIYFFFVDSREKIENLCNLISHIDGINFSKVRDIYSDNLWILEIFNNNASKYSAAKWLKNHGNYEKLIGFGDHLNDIPLFEACDECYAVVNAKPELKNIATGVIGSNENDGVVEFMLRKSQIILS